MGLWGDIKKKAKKTAAGAATGAAMGGPVGAVIGGGYGAVTGGKDMGKVVGTLEKAAVGAGIGSVVGGGGGMVGVGKGATTLAGSAAGAGTAIGATVGGVIGATGTGSEEEKKAAAGERPVLGPAELGTAGREAMQDRIAAAQAREAPGIEYTGSPQQMATTQAAAAQMAGTAVDPSAQAQWRAKQMGLAGDLEAQAAGRGGPSPAEMMMGRGMEQAMRQQISMARSGPASQRAMMQRQAATNVAGISQDVLSQMGIQRAGEQQAAREQFAQLAGQAREQDIGYGLGTARLGQESSMANLEARQQTALANLQAAQQSGQANLVAEMQTELANIETSRQNAQMQMQQTQMNDALTQYYMQQGMTEDMARMQAQQHADKLQAQMYGAEQGVAASEAAAPPDWSYWVGPGLAALGTAGAAAIKAPSDEDIKTKKRKVAKALDAFVKKLEPHGYNYTFEPHRRSYGVMAQDLEKSKIGASLVTEIGGVKHIDTGRGFGVALAAMKRLQQRVDALEGASHA